MRGACRIFSMEPIEGYRPPTLSGHRDSPLAVFFAGTHFTLS